jgi:hypothetical protein
VCGCLNRRSLPQFLESFEVVKTSTRISDETERQRNQTNQKVDIEKRRGTTVSGGGRLKLKRRVRGQESIKRLHKCCYRKRRCLSPKVKAAVWPHKRPLVIICKLALQKG